MSPVKRTPHPLAQQRQKELDRLRRRIDDLDETMESLIPERRVNRHRGIYGVPLDPQPKVEGIMLSHVPGNPDLFPGEFPVINLLRWSARKMRPYEDQLTPAVDLLVSPLTAAGVIIGVETARKICQTGVLTSWEDADRYAVALGVSPATVWPDHWIRIATDGPTDAREIGALLGLARSCAATALYKGTLTNGAYADVPRYIGPQPFHNVKYPPEARKWAEDHRFPDDLTKLQKRLYRRFGLTFDQPYGPPYCPEKEMAS